VTFESSLVEQAKQIGSCGFVAGNASKLAALTDDEPPQ
jgi:hypothetical protein